ncbi:MAG: hypothetical protein EOP04_22265 [Proteobacteria bacterium]|nr:MAG: hypothetical protein EOP04_22265 [Pseudomonadota bacterium]
MVSTILLVALSMAKSETAKPQEQVYRNELPMKVLNALINHNPAFKALQTCGRSIISSVVVRENQGLPEYVFQGYKVFGDIVIGNFDLTLTMTLANYEVGDFRYDHLMVLDPYAQAQCNPIANRG